MADGKLFGFKTTNKNEPIVRPLITQDEISLGRVDGASQINKFSYRDSTTAAGGEETIWATNTNFVVMKTAETFTITFNNTTEGSGAGAQGAKILQIDYLDAEEKLQSATVVLDASGSQVTSFTGLGINRCVVVYSGTSDINENDITITNTTSGNTQAIVPALSGVTQQAIVFIPDDKRGLMKWLLLSANKLSGSSPKVTFKGYVYSRIVDTYFEIFRHTMDTQSEVELDLADPTNFPLSPRDVLYFVMDTDQNSTVAECRFSLNLYDI